MSGKRTKAASEPKAAAPQKLRDPTEGELAAIRSARESLASRPARVSMSVTADDKGAVTISNPYCDASGWNAHIGETFGTSSDAFSNQSFARILSAVADRKKPITELEANAALALMGAIAPANELEAVIGEQIIAAHAASLDFLARARMNAGEYRESAVAYANLATRLSRTMATHIEALTKLRTGGRQRIEVVYVNGPAVIGDNAQTVITGGGPRVGGESIGQPHAPAALAHLAAATGLPLRRQDPEGAALPVACREGTEAVQDARRQ
jgi:hypothetical protein